MLKTGRSSEEGIGNDSSIPWAEEPGEVGKESDMTYGLSTVF